MAGYKPIYGDHDGPVPPPVNPAPTSEAPEHAARRKAQAAFIGGGASGSPTWAANPWAEAAQAKVYRRGIALNAAVAYADGELDPDQICEVADMFDAWLAGGEA